MKMQKDLLSTIVIIIVLTIALPLVHGQTTISFWHGYSEAETEVLQKQLIPRFEAGYPGITVDAVRMDYNDLRDKIVVSGASGSGPDVVRIDLIWHPEFSALGLLEPLGAYAGFDDIVANVYPGPLSTAFLNGAHYGLPITTNTQVLIYNADALAQGGLAVPETYDQFESVARRLTRRDGDAVTAWGYDIGGPWAWTVLPWIWSNGGAVTDDAITTATGYFDSPATIGAIDKIAEWAVEGLLAPNIFAAGFDQWGGFVNGTTSLRQDGPWFASYMEAEHPSFNAGYALMPRGSGGESISIVGGENIAMAKGSGNKEAAWAFMRFLLSDEAQAIMAASGQIPVIRSAISLPEFRDSNYYPVYLQQLLTAKARTPHPRYGEIEGVIQAAFMQAINGETSARIALTEAARLVDQMLR